MAFNFQSRPTATFWESLRKTRLFLFYRTRRAIDFVGAVLKVAPSMAPVSAVCARSFDFLSAILTVVIVPLDPIACSTVRGFDFLSAQLRTTLFPLAPGDMLCSRAFGFNSALLRVSLFPTAPVSLNTVRSFDFVGAVLS